MILKTFGGGFFLRDLTVSAVSVDIEFYKGHFKWQTYELNLFLKKNKINLIRFHFLYFQMTEKSEHDDSFRC